MALLGFHIVLSLIAATLFNKFQAQFTLCERLIYGRLKYYFLPEPPDPVENRLRKRGKAKNEVVGSDFRKQIFSRIMERVVITNLSFYPSLVWLIDYSFVSAFVFTCCQIFVYFFPKDNSTNVSVLWTIFSMSFALQILFKLLWKKFTNPNLGAERNLIFSFTLITFLVFMLANMFADQFIDGNLATGYRIVIENTKLMATNETTLMIEHSSPLFLFIFASILTSLIGAAFLMPVVQYTSLYRSLVDGEKTTTSVFHQAVFIMPLFILPLYLEPVREQILAQMPVLTPEHYSAIRVYIIIVWSLLRIFSVKPLLRVYLENAKDKALACGRHADGFETVRSHLSYLCATALQLIAPPLVIFFAALTLISLGRIFPLNVESPEIPTKSNLLDVLTDPRVQRTLWSYGLLSGVSLHSFISLITVLFGI